MYLELFKSTCIRIMEIEECGCTFVLLNYEGIKPVYCLSCLKGIRFS